MKQGQMPQSLKANAGHTHFHMYVIENSTKSSLSKTLELNQYRDLLWFLVLRNVKVRYAQSMMGVGWALIQPLFSMLVFTVVFGSLAKVSSDGVPYAAFSLVALVPWTYFANALADGTGSLVQNANMLKKVYFPRLILPIAACASKLVDFGIAFALLGCLLVWYRIVPSTTILLLPLAIGLMFIWAMGLSFWLTALAIQYRDVNYSIGFVTQLLMYAAPVVYPTSLVPEKYQIWFALNPMVGVIESFRAGLLGTREFPWMFLLIGYFIASLVFISGIAFFNSKEQLFSDVA
jgi:lipopolysaccharide transport system permease protein